MRGYIAPNDGSAGEASSNAVPASAGAGMPFKMRYRLPRGVSGDRCVLQWHYVTGNSCSSEDYADYAWPSPQWYVTNTHTQYQHMFRDLFHPCLLQL